MAITIEEQLNLSVSTQANTAADAIDRLQKSLAALKAEITRGWKASGFGDAIASSIKASTGKITGAAKKAADTAGKTAKAEIERQMNAAWAGHNAWTREQNRNYAKDNRLDWKRVDHNVQRENAKNTVRDNTAREIAEWKAAEDEKYEARMKGIAEAIVAGRTVSGDKSIRQIVNENAGIRSGRPKAAERSAYAMNAEMKKRDWQEQIRAEEEIRKAREAELATERAIHGKHLSYSDYRGKDWRRENAEDTAYFNQRLTDFSSTEALKGINASLKAKTIEAANATKAAGDSLRTMADEATAHNPVKSAVESAKASTAPSPGIKQYNPATGKFEPTQFASTREWLQKLDAERAEAEEQAKASEIESLRKEFGGSSDRVKSVIANGHGMSAEELFPKGAVDSAREAIVAAGNSAKEAAVEASELKEAVRIPDTPLEALRMKLEAVKKALAAAAEKGDKMAVAVRSLQAFSLDAKINRMEGIEALKNQLIDLYKNAEMTKEGLLNVGLAAAKVKLDNAVKYGDAEDINSAFANLERKQKASDDFYREQKAVAGLMSDLKNAGATDGMMSYAQSEVEAGRSASSLRRELIGLDGELKHKKTDSDAAAGGVNRFGQAAKKSTSHISKFTNRVGRMFSSLLMRTAMRSLIKSFKEAWDTAYEYSKHMKGSFADSIEKARGCIQSISLSVIKAFAPAINALIPVLSVITSAIEYLSNAIQGLFAQLGLASDLFGVAQSEIDKYAGSASNGNKKTKEMLASFDELNVISSESNSNKKNSGSSKTKSPFVDIVSDTMAELGMIVAEGMIGLGVVMACTGHIPLGLGMIALGAAKIVKTLTADWDSLTPQVKGTVAEIMTVASAAFFGLGAIMLMCGQVPLGIGLMVAGAANLAGVNMIAAKGGIPQEIKNELSTGLAIAGAALLGAGLLVAFVNLPLGIGMMLAGAASIFTATQLNPNGIKNIFKNIGDFISNVWNGIKNAASSAWEAVSKWFTDTIIDPIIRVWDRVSGYFRITWGFIKGFALAAWDKVKIWWEDTIVGNLRIVWEAVSGFFKRIWEGEDGKGGIKGAVVSAWETVSNWWDNGIVGNVSRVWDAIKGAFVAVWEAIKAPIESVWNFIKDIFGIGNHSATYQIQLEVYDPRKEEPVTYKPDPNGVSNPDVASKYAAAFDVFPTDSNAINVLKNNLNKSATTLKNDPKAYTYTSPSKVDDKTYKNNVKGLFYREIKDYTKQIESYGAGLASNLVDNFDLIFGYIPNANSVSSVVKQVVSLVSRYKYKWFNHLNELTYASKSGRNTISAYANGGLPNAGQLFLAREAGPELVGSIGNKTSVASNEQIVRGIASGVENANERQNQLLREQNALLRALLDKDASVRITPSAGLGRVVAQSAQMYGAVTGGR